jgi:hypothetical protein
MDIADCGTNAKPGALRKTAFVCAVTALFCLPALSFGLMAGIVYFGEDFFEGRSPRWFDGVLWALMLSLVASIIEARDSSQQAEAYSCSTTSFHP